MDLGLSGRFWFSGVCVGRAHTEEAVLATLVPTVKTLRDGGEGELRAAQRPLCDFVTQSHPGGSSMDLSGLSEAKTCALSGRFLA